MDLRAHPVHARPHADRRDRLVDLQPARARLRVPARADLRQPPPRRRDQPRPAEDAGRAPRGDAGAAGDERGRDAAARAPVPRARDAEPDRVRGHLPAAGGAARPLPAARCSVGYPAREDEWQVLANRAERRVDEIELAPLVDRETLLAMQARSSTCTCRRPSASTWSTSSPRPATRRRSRSARARAARSPCSSCRAAAPRSAAATT